jgi:predicted transcriptional regulator
MGPGQSHITDAEWLVMEQLWERGPATVRQLTQVLYPRGGASDFATVHKFLERLESKGFVHRERAGGVYWFRAAFDRNDIVGRQLETLVDKMCGGSLQPLLTTLVRTKKLNAAQLRELLALVEDLDAKSSRKKDRRSGGQP